MKLTLTYNPQYNRAHPDLGPELIETPVAAQSHYYTGIGSRETPAPVLTTMTAIASYLAERGYILRSGGASGADTAFEQGAGDKKKIYSPYPNAAPHLGTVAVADELWEPARIIASRIHPAWDRCNWITRQLHTRNIFQVTGEYLDMPSAFVVFYAPEAEGQVFGGTRTAVVYARELGIPTFNLLHGVDAFKAYLREVTR